MAAEGGPDIVYDGLVLALDAADKNSYPGSGTTWSDLAGTNNGTLINGSTFDSGNGGSIVFDGSNEYVDLSNTYNSSLITSAYTIESFCLLTNTASTQHGAGVLSIGDGSTNAGNYELLIQDVWLYGRMRTDLNNSATYTPRDSFSLTLNTWNHIISQFDGTYMRLYLNGDQVSNGTNLFSGQTLNISNIDTARIAQRHNSIGLAPFPGYVGIVRLYDRALSSSEILQNYNATKRRFGL